MAGQKSFEELVLQARAEDRARYGAALAAEKGPAPYSKTLDEDQQDELWQEKAQQYDDPPQVETLFRSALQQYRAMKLPDDQAVAQAATYTATIYPQSAFMRLLVPQERGGMGLTPLAASLERYPQRRRLYESAGESIEDHTKYANLRQKRIAEKQMQPRPPAEATTATPQEGGGY